VGSGEDYRALIQDLRFRCKGRRKFREISDFLSHRDVRDRGPVTNLVRDIFVSARVFAMILGNQIPTVAEARAAAHANLRLATDATIAAECAMSRKVPHSLSTMQQICSPEAFIRAIASGLFSTYMATA
jgi:hypothetical protein